MEQDNAYITESDLIEFEIFKESKPEIPPEVMTESQCRNCRRAIPNTTENAHWQSTRQQAEIDRYEKEFCDWLKRR